MADRRRTVNQNLIDALRAATPEEVAEALLSLDKERPGFGYDVGIALYERDAGKEVPGPDPFYWADRDPNDTFVVVTGFKGSRLDAIRGFRKLWKLGMSEAKAAVDRLASGETVERQDSLHGAREEVGEWAAFGVEARVEDRGPAPPATHRVSLHGLGVAVAGAPIGGAFMHPA
jgi:ribosomal protein L7/L12